MQIILDRQGNGKKPEDTCTIGVLYIYNMDVVYTLEDDYDPVKEYAHTRIPAGEYELKLRTYGGHHERYSKRFPDMHVGMIQLVDVPGYTDILIHCGNTKDDTAGCILVGMAVKGNTITGSTAAYEVIYPTISRELMLKRKVTIKIED